MLSLMAGYLLAQVVEQWNFRAKGREFNSHSFFRLGLFFNATIYPHFLPLQRIKRMLPMTTLTTG